MPELRGRFLNAIVKGDFSGALAVAKAARERGLAYLYEQTVAGALREVGGLWQSGKITVADEHVATAVAQSVLANFYPAFPWTPSGPKGVVACAEGERHELGARMAADLLACDGWNVCFAGADVPVDALVELVVRESPVFVGLSAALPERLPALRETIARIRKALPAVKIIVGGRVAASSDIDLGADVVLPNAAEAVAAVRAWRT